MGIDKEIVMNTRDVRFVSVFNVFTLVFTNIKIISHMTGYFKISYFFMFVAFCLCARAHKQPEGCWEKVFTIAAMVHLFGITFYAIFASGELQYWAEPSSEEQQSWAPGNHPPQHGQFIKETSFVSSQVS